MRSAALAVLMLCSADAIAAANVYPHPLPSQELQYEAGVPRIISRQPSTTVVFEVFPGRSGSRGGAGFTVINVSGAPVTVLESSVSATIGGEPITVEGQTAMLKREKRRQFWEGMAAGLAGAANAYGAAQAGQGTAQASYSGTAYAYGSGGYARANFSGTATIRYTDPMVQQQAQANAAAQNQAMFDRVQAEQAARKQAIAARGFTSQTIAPGAAYAGVVEYKYPSARKTRVAPGEFRIVVGGETHRFVVGIRQPISEAMKLAYSAQPSTEATSSQPMTSIPLAIAAPAPLTQPASVQQYSPASAPVMELREASTADFLAMADGSVRDARTGIRWRVKHDRAATWFEAQSFCSELGEDWHMPSAGELQSIHSKDRTYRSPCGDVSCSVAPVFSLPNAAVWTGEITQDGQAWLGSMGKEFSGYTALRTQRYGTAICASSAAG